MKKIIRLSFVILLITSLILSCSKEEDETINSPPFDPFAELNLLDDYFNYANIQLLTHISTNEFPRQFQFQAVTEYDNTPIDNPIPDAGASN